MPNSTEQQHLRAVRRVQPQIDLEDLNIVYYLLTCPRIVEQFSIREHVSGLNPHVRMKWLANHHYKGGVLGGGDE